MKQSGTSSCVPTEWKCSITGKHLRTRGFLQFLDSLLRFSSTAAMFLSSWMALALQRCHSKSLLVLSAVATQDTQANMWNIWHGNVTQEFGSISYTLCTCSGGGIETVVLQQQMHLLLSAVCKQHNARLAFQLDCSRQFCWLLDRSLPIKAGHSTSQFQHHQMRASFKDCILLWGEQTPIR